MEETTDELEKCINAFEIHIKGIGMNPRADTVRMEQFLKLWKVSWFKSIELRTAVAPTTLQVFDTDYRREKC